jgi:hypothetical protein
LELEEEEEEKMIKLFTPLSKMQPSQNSFQRNRWESLNLI